ncbi:leishmanolysin-related zinc metalloendopeptidase [Amycolatopsis sp. NPDC024027]|uniref:leishmanolysin-related zinc metalloendopeptidase n=1 Tax=Amycolatopsis sp. NPDC024027 TaxID=3154327 RepID=UPI0033D1455F
MPGPLSGGGGVVPRRSEPHHRRHHDQHAGPGPREAQHRRARRRDRGRTISATAIANGSDPTLLADIDGVGHVLGQAHITHVRPAGREPWALLPVRGEMTFDRADLVELEATGILGDVITHEMGHVLGIASLWGAKGLLVGKGTSDPAFTGPAAMAEYPKLRGSGDLPRVPVEDAGGPGTRDVHWRERSFGNELMTGLAGHAPNPLSRITAASLGDLGYQVDVDAADSCELPADRALTAAGVAVHALAVTPAPVELPRQTVVRG